MPNYLNQAIIFSAGTLILIGLVLLPYGLGKRNRWAPAVWGIGNIFHGIGWLVPMLPSYSSRPSLLLLANLCFTVALGLVWAGTAHFTNRTRPMWVITAPSLLVLLTFPIFLYALPSLSARIIIMSTLMFLYLGDIGRMQTTDRHRPTQFIGYTLIGVGFLHLLRAFAALISPWRPDLIPLINTPGLAVPSIIIFTVLTVGILVSSAHRSEQEMSELLVGLKVTSLTDLLTNLPNRRFMQERLEEAKRRLDRHGEVFSILILDVDHFKRINDSHGHEVGDYVLQGVAESLQSIVGREHMLARWGGEEFVVLMLGADKAAAHRFAEHLRTVLAEERIHHGDTTFHITVTIGGATASPGQTLTELIRSADHALYQGKQTGRNQVRWA